MYAFKSDEKNIYISNKEILKKLNLFKKTRYGSNSSIYYYNNELFKVMLYGLSPDTVDLFEYIKSLKPTNIILPKKYLIINDKIEGYSMDRFDGNMIIYNNKNVLIKDFIKSISSLEGDIKLLSKNNILMQDINYFNILYNNISNISKIIDIDLYQKLDNRKNLINTNMTSFYITILNSLFFYKKHDISYIFNSKIYRYIINIIYEKFDFDISIIDNFNYILDLCMNYFNKEINTFNDLKKILK